MVTHALCFSCSAGGLVRRGTPIALAPKKTLALQARRGPPSNIALVPGESGASATASSIGLAPPVMVPTPFVGQAIGVVEGSPSGVAPQPVTKAIPPLALEQAKLSAAPAASTTAVEAQLDEVLASEVEVMVATTDGS